MVVFYAGKQEELELRGFGMGGGDKKPRGFLLSEKHQNLCLASYDINKFYFV